MMGIQFVSSGIHFRKSLIDLLVDGALISAVLTRFFIHQNHERSTDNKDTESLQTRRGSKIDIDGIWNFIVCQLYDSAFDLISASLSDGSRGQH